SIELSASLDDINNNISDYKWTTDSAILNIRPNSKIGFLHIPYNYSKDSIKVVLSVWIIRTKLVLRHIR
ncbi:MAG: hypothetical protein WCT77_13345, partial [Bacteroidota bacterium]